MSTLRGILDRLNDVEATIVQIARDAGGSPSSAAQLTLRSLESRREMLQEELFEETQREFLDVCDYRLVPDFGNTYSVSAVAGAWRDFQDILSLVYSAIKSGEPKSTAKLSLEVSERTQLNLGHMYAGSLGVILTIPSERFLLDHSDLEKSVSAVFKMLKAQDADQIKSIRQKYGMPVVRRLYSLSKVHSQFSFGADIKWLRDKEVVGQVRNQPSEFAEICRLIEGKSDTVEELFSVEGTLLAWNTKTRTFVLDHPNGGQISGRWADDFPRRRRTTVPARYAAKLTKLTTVRYAEERDIVAWRLHSLTEIGNYGD